MFFDILAVTIITFFAALGMVEASDFLFKKSCRKNIECKIFSIANMSSVPENDIEDAVRCLLIDDIGKEHYLILDCRNTENETKNLCRNLEKRFNCAVIESEKELCDMIVSGLHGE